MFGGRDDATQDSWRAVPKISVIDPPRAGAVTPVIMLLVLVVVVELLVVQFLYRDYSSGKTAADALQVEADNMASRLSLQEGDMADSEVRIGDIDNEIKAAIEQTAAQEATRDNLSTAYDEILVRPDWAGAFDAILRADGGAIAIQTIRTEAGGRIEASGTATGITAISGLQNQFRSASDILDLISLQLDNADGSQTFRAKIRVR